MKVRHRQQLGLALSQPFLGGSALTLGAVPIAAAVVGDERMRAVLCALCRFSTAGSDDLIPCSAGRRLNSAKARNRGGGWYDGSTAGYGDLAAA